MNEKRVRYSEEFKTMCLELCQNGKTTSDMLNEYGINKTTIYKWANERKEIKLDNEQTIKLKFRIHELEKENDTLKKALAIFAKG